MKKSEQIEIPYIEKMRHSCAHVLAQAVLKLYPETKLGIGPAIENGFYYDFEFSKPITEEVLAKIEEEMKNIIKENLPLKQEFRPKKDVEKYYKSKKQEYKLDLLKNIPDDPVSFFVTGEKQFEDLCRGPHVESTGKIGAIKLERLAGAYWKGDEKNKMLTRIYGYCFESQEQLDQYLWQLEEAKKRDHKKLGPKLGIFMFSPIVGPGLPILLPKGALLRRKIDNYLTKIKEEYGHKFVWTPHIARSQLYMQSKHWQKYDAMMPPMKMEDDEYTLKPMSCPHHFQIYLDTPKSYRDLPLKLAENATVYRYEKSGVLSGLLRVRSITQDDSHWFLPHELLGEETDKAIELMQRVYNDFGLSKYRAQISIRDSQDKSKYLGDDKTWTHSEKVLQEAIEKRKIEYRIIEGEAAFYGPKIDLMAQDSLGREWQLMTIQLDFNQPENFDMKYIDKDGKEKRPAVLHIAILGSIERFLGILIEHYYGNFPLWLAPIQVRVVPIAERHFEYAKDIAIRLRKKDITAEVDDENDTMQSKIRKAEIEKIPYVLIVGDKEIGTNTVSVRPSGKKDMGIHKYEELEEMLIKEIDTKSYNTNT